MNWIQNVSKHSPANWLSSYQFEKEKNIFVDKIQASTLKHCLKLEQEDSGAVDEIFENDLKEALEYVEKDVDENLQDSIDFMAKSLIAK